jgi:predicted transcriptional regulator
MNEEESDKTTLKTENRNRNKENRRQIIDFIADNGISDAKSISKVIGLKPSRTRDYLKQLVDEGILEVEGEYKTGSIGLRSEWLVRMGIWYNFAKTRKYHESNGRTQTTDIKRWQCQSRGGYCAGQQLPQPSA